MTRLAPEPKKFTDEELKKYGIHMASRLDEDDALLIMRIESSVEDSCERSSG